MSGRKLHALRRRGCRPAKLKSIRRTTARENLWFLGGGAGYAMCNCCLDGCLPLMNRRAYRNYRFIRGTYVAQVDADRCTTCGTCAEVCAFGARGTDGSLNVRHCYGCGLCADTCPAGAVTMVLQEW